LSLPSAAALWFVNEKCCGRLPHGGGKSVIFGNPRMPNDQKEQVMRAFACAIRDIADCIPGPDMGTDELCMGWVKDETGRATGLPSALGGIPLDQVGATGYGLAACTDVAREFIGLELKGARVAVPLAAPLSLSGERSDSMLLQRLRSFLNSDKGRVLMTSAGSSQPRRAWSTPNRIYSSAFTECASVEIASLTPIVFEARASISFKSRRPGSAFISRKHPTSCAAEMTRRMSMSWGSRSPIRRPVGWAIMETWRFSMARMTRSVCA
jgi:hypothetical protein